MAKAKARKAGPPKKRTPPPVVAKPKPWGLITATAVVILFAAGVIGYAVYDNVNAPSNDPQDLAQAAAKIEGVVVKDFAGGDHVTTAVPYEDSPPFGGTHDPEWADCTGTVYDQPIRSENAVHSLEHGSIWITYRPDLPESDVEKLKDRVEGEPYTLMSPYPDLKDKLSLQSWGYQLFVSSVDDERIDEFIRDLRNNPQTAPEFGGNCANPNFRNSPRPPEQQVAPPPSTAPSATPTPAPTSSNR